MPFDFQDTDIAEVKLIKPRVFSDSRGSFMEVYKKSDFINNGIATDFIQDNHSKSDIHVLRGLHYQITPKTQGKLVRCVRGAVFDVAVDIRKSSPTFMKWVGYELSEDNQKMLWLPEGFAHGFLTLTQDAEVTYKVSGGEYSPEHERSIIWNDPELNIKWPVSDVKLSDKDAAAPLLKDAEVF